MVNDLPALHVTPGTCVVCINVKGRKARNGEPIADGAWFVHSVQANHEHLYLYTLINHKGEGVGRIPHRCLREVTSPRDCSLSFDAAYHRWLHN